MISNKKKRGIILALGLIFLTFIYILSQQELLKAYYSIHVDDYSINYSFISGKGAETHLTIEADGSYRGMRKDPFNGYKVEHEKGAFRKEELKKFLRIALRKNILRMQSDMNEENLMDGNTIYFKIILGGREYQAGGYGADLVSKKFDSIWRAFMELEAVTNTGK